MITGVMFDVLAKVPVNYMHAPFNTPEREMAMELIKELGPGDLLVLDRGYPGYRMFHAIINQPVDLHGISFSWQSWQHPYVFIPAASSQSQSSLTRGTLPGSPDRCARQICGWSLRAWSAHPHQPQFINPFFLVQA